MTKPTCEVGGCDRQAVTRGWCKKHYERWRRHGDALAGTRGEPIPEAAIQQFVALCRCGCGQPTRVARRTDTRALTAKGQPLRFLPGHISRAQRRDPGLCTVEGCDRPRKGRHLCGGHLKRVAATGDPGGPLTRPSAIERIVRRSTEQPAPKSLGPSALPCWIARPNTPDGRLKIKVNSKGVFAYRLTYEELIGPLPDGLVSDHLCRRPACVNPWHIDPVPNVVNILRGTGPTAVNAAAITCKDGHPLAGDNLRIETAGRRRCLACTRARWRRQSKNPALAGLPADALYRKELPKR